MTIPEAIALALQHHQAGRLADAEAIYRQVLAVQPNHADALHLLGMIALHTGRFDVAEDLFRRAIAAVPDVPEFYNNLGNALAGCGRLDEALAACRRALEIRPDFAGAHNNLGMLLRDQGSFEEALAAHRRAVELEPGWAEARYTLGIVHADLGELEEAAAAYGHAVELASDFAAAHNNLGNVLRGLCRFEKAIAAFDRALLIQPDFSDALVNKGNALSEAGQLDEAVAAYSRAIELAPNLPETHNNLGEVLRKLCRLDEAAAAFDHALTLRPDFCEALVNKGAVFWIGGRVDEAIAAQRAALRLRPDSATRHSDLIFTIQYSPEIGRAEMIEEHRRWNEDHAAPLMTAPVFHPNDPSPDRKLRIGYVSADFRNHAVGRTLLPCFEAHDRSQFDLVCYSGTGTRDATNERFRSGATIWRETAFLSDEKLAAQIHEDRIDILVDLSLHTAGNRLTVFARKPAPVQISWLGSPGTSGVEAMDFRITDSWLEPPGAPAWSRTEEPLRLPDAWCCYGAAEDSPEPAGLPAAACGAITFCSFNNPAKINARVVALWAAILRRVEGSRLLLLATGGGHDRVRRSFEECGVAAERLEFLTRYPPVTGCVGGRESLEYLERYRQGDIALDPFPYNGMTTTCDALWMGVPVVALIGGTPISRASFSLLSNVGLAELAAPSDEQYAEIAVRLAGDLPRLASLRASLRDRMKSSPLLDAGRFARNLEATFRMAWRRWCSAQGAVSSDQNRG